MAKAKEQFYGTGRRKSSVARVYLKPGKGNITVNKRELDDYFGLETLKTIVRQPLVATETEKKYDINVNVRVAELQVRQVLSVMVSQERFLRLMTNSVPHLRQQASLQETLV